MKRKFQQLLSAIVLSALCLPALPAGANQDGPFVGLYPEEQPQNLIKVIQAVPQYKIDAARQIFVASLGCDFAVARTATLIQDQHRVNLNQPADCFSLEKVSLAQPQAGILVSPLIRADQKIVALPPSKIASVHYKNSTQFPAQSTGTIPVSATVVAFAAVGFSIFTLKTGKTFLNRIRQALGLEQLRVMRC